MASHARHLHTAGRTWRGDTCWLLYTVNVEQRKTELWLCSAPTRPSDAPCKAVQESTATCMCLRRCSLQDQLDRQPGRHTDSELVLWQTPRSLDPQPIFYHPPVGGSGKPGPQPPSGSQSIGSTRLCLPNSRSPTNVRVVATLTASRGRHLQRTRGRW